MLDELDLRVGYFNSQDIIPREFYYKEAKQLILILVLGSLMSVFYFFYLYFQILNSFVYVLILGFGYYI